MKLFNADAWRPARGKLRANKLSAANDLVQRTLAQHGLLGTQDTSGTSDAPAPGPGAGTNVMATVQDALAKAGLMGDARGAEDMPLPEGAEFRHGNFDCDQGARSFRTYVPASLAGEAPTGLVLMLHGCTQTPEDFARGTGMNALAETHRFIVVYPHQTRGANAQSCWNWFSPNDQVRGRGEPAILAGLVAEVAAEFDIPAERTFVAGLSAGAAMALILGNAYPERFGAVGCHSGLPVGAAQDIPSAFSAMGGSTSGRPLHKTVRNFPRCIVFHGSADATVRPANGEAIARQLEAGGPAQSLQVSNRGESGQRRFQRTTTTDTEGSALIEHWVIDGLGHAWSGGSPAGSYTDPEGPDASAEMVRFFFDTPKKAA